MFKLKDGRTLFKNLYEITPMLWYVVMQLVPYKLKITGEIYLVGRHAKWGWCRCAIIVRKGLRGRSLLSDCDRNRSREASVSL